MIKTFIFLQVSLHYTYRIDRTTMVLFMAT